MKIQTNYKQYIIQIYDDDQYNVESTDNINRYKYIYISEPDIRPISKHAIKVFNKEQEISSAIIIATGGGSGVHEQSYIIYNDLVFICVSAFLYCLCLPNLSLKWQTLVDDSSVFEIYLLNNNIIIHGELAISRINIDGKIIWQHYGSDIFTTIDGRDTFRIQDNIIIAKSWDGREYNINFNGKILKNSIQ
jgi:hypothetical protein